LKQLDLEMAVAEICRKLGVTEATFYNWKKKNGELWPSELKRLSQLEEENRQLKQLVADLSLDNAILQEVRHPPASSSGTGRIQLRSATRSWFVPKRAGTIAERGKHLLGARLKATS